MFLAVTTIAPLECKETNKENPIILADNVIPAQNQADAVQKNHAFTKYDRFVTNRTPDDTRLQAAVLDGMASVSASTVLDDMNAEQSYYQSPLMMYPFPMTNTYYPRYFPYDYPPRHLSGYYPGYYPGYLGYPYVG